MNAHFGSDLYEGTRAAKETDLDGIRQLLKPLEESGTLIQRTDEEVLLVQYNVDFFFFTSLQRLVFGTSLDLFPHGYLMLKLFLHILK